MVGKCLKTRLKIGCSVETPATSVISDHERENVDIFEISIIKTDKIICQYLF